MTQAVQPATVLRVAQVTLGLEMGGQERLLVEMAQHRDASRFKWTVIVLGQRGPLADALEAASVRVLALEEPDGFRAGLWWRLAALFRQEQFDVVHTHDDRPLVYGMPAAWWAGIPRLIHTHHHGRLASVRWQQRMLLRRAASFVQQFVCVSHDSARYVIEQGVPAARVKTLWNGIDLARFAYQEPCHDGSIVTVARLSPEKDIATLLHAARQVINHLPRARFEIAGDGPCRNQLTQLAKDLQLEKNVIFHGEVRDIPALLGRGRLFVLPSQSEGISLTLLEAMARGLPIVATQVGGNPELVVSGHTGLLVSPRDPMALAQAILQLNNAKVATQMGVAGRRRVEAYFDIREMIAAYEAIYSGQALPAKTNEGECVAAQEVVIA
jgi:sugar transferase (PEP-CTERM/EpsH1 system associated)